MHYSSELFSHIHLLLRQAVMTGLESGEGSLYSYRVSNGPHTSKTFSFGFTSKEKTLKFLSYGDMGVKNSWTTVAQLAKDTMTG